MLSVLRLVGSVLMGNQLALFQKAVREGDTSKAYTLYYSKETVRTKVDPNASLGPEWDGNTLLHYIAYHAMKKLYEDMITQHRGKPDFKNDKRQNCMHLLCATGEEGSVKRDMLQFTLSVGLPGMDLGHLLKEKDQVGSCGREGPGRGVVGEKDQVGSCGREGPGKECGREAMGNSFELYEPAWMVV